MEFPLAYLDPGSGSMIVQLIVGGLAAAGVAAKLYWNKLMRLLRIKKADPVQAKPATPTTAAAQTPPAPPTPAQPTAAEPDAAQR
jgi:hypothetical protein